MFGGFFFFLSFLGSSNSQDSFPSGPGGGMDGYGYGYGSEYGNQRGPPPMQSNQGMHSEREGKMVFFFGCVC